MLKELNIWEIYSFLMDFEPDFEFTAKELAENVEEFSKKELNSALHQLAKQKAVLLCGKTYNQTCIYKLNPNF